MRTKRVLAIALALTLLSAACGGEDATETTGLGTVASRSADTVLLYPGASASSFRWYDADASVTEIHIEPDPVGVTVRLSRAVRATYLRLSWPGGIGRVELDGEELVQSSRRAALDSAEQGWARAADEAWLWVKVPARASAVQIVVN